MRSALTPLLTLVLVCAPATAQAPRPGASLSFATLGSSGGMQGSAFLPIAPSDVRPRAADATCPNARLEIRARGLRGFVRDLRVTMPDVSSAGTLDIGAGCTEATVRAKLEDGAEVTGAGTVRVTRVFTNGPVKLELALDWAPRVGNATLPMTGQLVVPAPPVP